MRPIGRGYAMRGGRYARLRRAGRAEERRHASSRRLCHRPRAHHRLLPRHRQRQGMLHVPTRYQQSRALIERVLRGSFLLPLRSSVRRLYRPVFLFIARSVSLHEKGKEKKYILFCSPFDFLLSSLCFPVNRLLLRYLCATLRLPFRLLRVASASRLSLAELAV